MEEKPDNEAKEKKIKPATLIGASVIILAAYIVLVGILIYAFQPQNRVINFTAKIIPYPAAIIGGTQFVNYSVLGDNLQSVQKFYESQDFSDIGLRVDFATTDGQKRLKIKEKDLLTRMIENKLVEMMANEKGIKISPEIISQELKRRLQEMGGQKDLEENLTKLYGWDLAEFQEYIVKPDLYRERLDEYISKNDPANTEARKKIENAKKELDDKKDFAEVADNYSDGESAKSHGELGWFSAEEMLPVIAETVFALKVGEISPVIQSSLGYHIVKLEDRKTEDDVEKVKISQIFTRGKNSADWLAEKEKNVRIYVPLRGFSWNKETGSVEFTDQNLRQFEENLNNNSPGDASLIF